MPLEGAQAVYDQVQKDAGCSDLGCLAKMDWAEVGKFGTAAGLRGYCKYHTSYEPVVDGVELMEPPEVSAATGRLNPVRGVLLGSTASPEPEP